MPPPTDATPKSFMLSAFATSRQLDHQATLRLMFAVHFALTCCVLLGTWPSITYTFYNTFLLVGLLWTLTVSANGCELPLTKCIFIETIAIVFDICVMWSSYHVAMSNTRSGFVEGFALFMCIFQLLLRPVAVLLLLHIRTDILKANRYENVEDVTAMLGAGGHHHHHQISPPMAIPIVGITTDNCGGGGQSAASTYAGYSSSYETPVPTTVNNSYLPPAYLHRDINQDDDTKFIIP